MNILSKTSIIKLNYSTISKKSYLIEIIISYCDTITNFLIHTIIVILFYNYRLIVINLFPIFVKIKRICICIYIYMYIYNFSYFHFINRDKNLIFRFRSIERISALKVLPRVCRMRYMR